jgi:N-acetylglucosaminyldiphosphoundecaprenol N-acetyl-beta-D-mannosaminyltransferase
VSGGKTHTVTLLIEANMQSKMNILGINMDCLSYGDMHRVFNVWLSDKQSRSHSLALINVNCCVSALFDKSLVNLYNSADIVGIDGMPFLKWARTFYNKKADRFYAPDLMLEAAKKAKEYGYTFFLYGGSPGAPEKMEEYIQEKAGGGVQVVGKYSPPFRALTEEEDQAICDMINAAKPDIVWVGLGSPKQDVWISEHREKIRGSIVIASGATFDFFSGRIQQAPEWIRNAGFEWLYRLSKDFRRLWVRYTVYNFVFVTMFLLQLTRLRRFDTEGYGGGSNLATDIALER